MKIGRNNVILSQRLDTAVAWNNENPVLAAGEIGVEQTPTVGVARLKIGDGTTHWKDLPYIGATDLGVNGIASPNLSTMVGLTEDEHQALDPKDPNTVYLVTPNT